MLTFNTIAKAQEFADQALKRIEEYALLPTPENYELWFVYFSNSDPEMVKVVDSYLKNAGKITEEQCFDIYQNFLSGFRQQRTVEEAGDQIQRTIDDINVAVTSAKTNAVKYTESLKITKDQIEEKDSVEAVSGLLDGVLKDTDKMIDHNELLEDLLQDSARAMEDMRRDLEAAKKEAMTDSLTGLANRKAFDMEVCRLAEFSNADDGHIFCLILMDIDHFKNFNDTFGHLVGDQVLKLVSRTLKQSVKGRDFASRYGGEEFAILLPETNIQGGMKIAEILRKEVENKEVINRATGKKIAQITISAGVAQFEKGTEVETLIGNADKALYEAKDKGRNQVVAATVSRS